MTSLIALGQGPGEMLRENKQTIAVAESSAGGLISAALLSVPGASAYYLGGEVIYTRESRRALMGIEDSRLEGIRASTEDYARLMARTVREQLGTTWGLSETGATGPTGNRYGDAAGHACIAVDGPELAAITLETGESGREENMWAFTAAALELLTECIRRSR